MFKKIGNSFLKIFDNIEKNKYKRSIQNYSSPKQNTTRIAKDIEGLTEFDLTNDVELEGSTEKRFVMLDRSYVKEFINEVKQGNNFYRTYLDNEDIKNDEIPSKISILLKLMSKSELYYEVAASKIMNYFELETSYCFGLIDDDEKKNYLASIDFIRQNEEFLTLTEFQKNDKYTGRMGINLADTSLREILKNIKSEKHLILSKKDIEDIVEQVLYSFLIRRGVIGDYDLHSGNVGLLIKNRKVVSVPAFDFDRSFFCFTLDINSLNYVYKNYNNVYQKFKTKFCEITDNFENNNSIIQKIIYEAVPEQEIQKKCFKPINHCVKMLNEFFYSIENEKEKI